MIEVRFHGRGGQGVVIASQILAVAAFKEGLYSQSFSVFGGERRGAPVQSFTRIDEKAVPLRCKVYYPDHTVVLDCALMRFVDVTQGLKDGGWIIVNSEQKPEEMTLPFKFSIATVDASSIALRHGLGTPQAPLVNTVMLGAFSRVVGIVSLQAILDAIREEVPARKEENASAARDAYDHINWIRIEDR